MVQSRLRPGLNYTEDERVEDDDEGNLNDYYILPIFPFGQDVAIALGEPIYDYFNSDNVNVFPIYLSTGLDSFKKIGVYEIEEQEDEETMEELKSYTNTLLC